MSQNNKKSDNSEYKVRFMPIGGLGEVGMNCMIVDLNGERIMIDCGVTFPDVDAFGVDLFMADWVDELQHGLSGVFITHGHEDHIGAVPYLVRDFIERGMQVPIYGTPLALSMIEHKLREHNLLKRAELFEVKPRQEYQHGSFTFELINVNHSIPDAVALVFNTPLGAIIHTGDWRIDHTPIGGEPIDLARFSEYGDEGVFCMLGDSTNVMTPGTSMSESEVAGHLRRAIDEAPGRVVVSMFSSNLWRVQALLDIAHGLGRKVMTMGRSLSNNIAMGRQNGYLKLGSDDLIIEPYDLDNYPPEEILVICTGSQGETRAALTQMAYGERRQMQLEPGDRVILSARVIPGNEIKIGRMIDAMRRLGVEIITPKDAPIHTTGHAYREEMRTLLALVRPTYFVPVHGTSRMMLAHAKLAQDAGARDTRVLHNGDVLEVSEAGMEVVDQRVLGRQFVDGSSVCSAANSVLRARRRLARAGVVVVALELDVVAGELLADPEIVQIGAWDADEEPGVHEQVFDGVVAALEKLSRKEMKDTEQVREAARLSVRRLIRKEHDRKPIIEVVVIEVDES
ncbi:MAG: ribonuclease J [Myxococcales bacterium]|nr:ribonuclease J [Myxococcales bacterium]